MILIHGIHVFELWIVLTISSSKKGLKISGLNFSGNNLSSAKNREDHTLKSLFQSYMNSGIAETKVRVPVQAYPAST